MSKIISQSVESNKTDNLDERILLDNQKNTVKNQNSVQQMYEREGVAFLGKISLTKDMSVDDILTLYVEQAINDFEYAFCIPQYDSLIISLISEWNMNCKYETINEIFERLKVLRGIFFYWQYS